MTTDPRTVSHQSLLVATVTAVILVLVGHRQLGVSASFDSQDHVDAYVRAMEYSTEWTHGHWAQSLPHAFFDGGDAFPRFYPPISHLAAGAAYKVVGDPILAVHLTGFIALALGCVLLGLLVHRLTQSALLAGVAGTAYGLFPYTFLQLQVRGAFAEALAAAWYPLILLAALRSAESRRLHPMYPIAIALLMLTHTVMTIWTLPVLIGVLILAQPERLLAFRHAAVAGALGTLLAGFHLVSLFIGVPTVRAADPEVLHATPTALSLANQRFGLAGVSVLIFPAILLVGAFLVWRALRLRKGSRPNLLGYTALTGAFVLAAMIVAPEPVWRALPQQLLYLQFPVRLLSPVSFLLILALMLIPSWSRVQVSKRAIATLFAAAATAAFMAGRGTLMHRSLTAEDVRRLVRSDFSAFGFNVDQAFLPRGTEPKEITNDILRIRASVGAGPLIRWDTEGPDPIGELDLRDAARVTLPLVRQDFLVPRLADGTVLGTESDRGLLAVSLPSGRHVITVGRRIPPVIAVAMLISAATFLVLSLWGILRVRRRAN